MTSKFVLDLKGVFSPLSLLKCKGRLKSMTKDDVLEVILTDEDVVNDLIMIVKRSSDTVLYRKNEKDWICIGIKRGMNIY